MTSSPSGSDAVTEFLRRELANGALPVCELEVLARAQGLIGGEEALTHKKSFKNRKKALGIRSVRNGFGTDGQWCWSMPPSSAPVPEGHLSMEVPATYGLRRLDPEPIAALEPVDLVHLCGIPNDGRIPRHWIEGIASLNRLIPPKDVPAHRWRLFLHDCDRSLFARENGAGRAAELGWTAQALFAFRFSNPLAYLGSAGPIWHVAGGKLTKLNTDWALIENNGTQRVFHRRDTYSADIMLPWRVR